ncbi:response regulator transcription factor [Jidongwangia harbinensis]|uniref:response regulator transcription factor n=1 Tax=Jidongwangia harbinensis TaxID=2878561 RepID=UPI001CD9F425|nr:response regulator transcription factor [Jidongwangia harbinensis]MCA2218408.1 response regulator transcription factor [Jidongwangia harbinensis]
MRQVRVALHTPDSFIRAGLTRFLQPQPRVELVPDAAAADVLTVAVHRLTVAGIADLRAWIQESRTPVVLVIGEMPEKDLRIALQFKVASILPLSAVTAKNLMQAIDVAVAGGAMMPPDVIGMVLRQLTDLQNDVLNRYGLTPSRLTTREIDVLRLVADGMDTEDIAATLNLSPRTVKNLIATARDRLNLRTRTQAVAYAVRTGVI